MKIRQILIATSLSVLLIGCKSKAALEPPIIDPPPPNMHIEMPPGKLLRVKYYFQGMMMEPYGHFDLNRKTENGSCKLSFRHYTDDVSFEVSDTLLDAARRIIEEEKMYEYDSYYQPDDVEMILDGYSWGFEAYFEDDRRISSGGNQLSPGGEGLSRISKLLQEAAMRCWKEHGGDEE